MDGYQVFIMVMGFLVIYPEISGYITRWEAVHLMYNKCPYHRENTVQAYSNTENI